jgi:peroxin-14
METVITSLKDSSRRRDDDSRRMEDDIRNLGLLVPKALDAHKEGTASQLRELGTELKSLKTLVSNRMGSTPATNARPVSGAGVYGLPSNPSVGLAVNGTSATSPAPVEPSTASGAVQSPSSATDAAAAATSPAAAEQPRPYSPYGRLTNGRASIPAWQMAAAKKSQDQDSTEKKDTSESGTVTDASTTA